MENKELIRFLIINEVLDKAELMIDLIRDKGYATRAKAIKTFNDFEVFVSSNGHYDILLIQDPPASFDLLKMFSLLQERNIDLPCIFMTDNLLDATALLKMGVRAVIPRDDNELFVSIVEREYLDVFMRQQYYKMNIALEESYKQRRFLLQEKNEAIVYISSGLVKYANSAFCEMLSVDEAYLNNKLFSDLVIEDDREHITEFLASIESEYQAVSVLQCDLIKAKSSKLVPIKAIITPTSFEGCYVLSLQILPQSKNTAAQIQQAAPDSQTGLFNQTQFESMLSAALQKVSVDEKKSALCHIRVTELAKLDELYGKEHINELLTLLGKALVNTWAYKLALSTDSYYMLMPFSQEKELLQEWSSLKESFTNYQLIVNEVPHTLNLEMGATIIESTGQNVATLMAQARAALLKAPSTDGFNLFTKRQVTSVKSVENKLVGAMGQALKSRQLEVRYQPVVALSDSSIHYYETTLQMQHEEALCTDTMLRKELDKEAIWSEVDRFQILEASKALMFKRQNGMDTRLLIHLGSKVVEDASFLPWIKVALKASKLPASAFVFEFRESALIKHQDVIASFLGKLKKLGSQTAISEFGCALNPVDAIEALDVDLVKMDNSFMTNLEQGTDAINLKEIIRSLKRLDKKVIVPEINNANEMAQAYQLGADFVQGNYMQSASADMDFDFGAEG